MPECIPSPPEEGAKVNEPKVSVIIPVYNVEKYLGKCLDSVLRQTLKDIEVICVDDGSTDSSPRILADYAAKDPRMKVRTLSNAGAGAARNAGMSMASGEYLFFHDSDDWCDKRMLGRLYAAAGKGDCDIVLTGMSRHDGKCAVARPMYPARRILAMKHPFSGLDAADFIFTDARTNPYNKLFKRAFIASGNVRFGEMHRFEDMVFSFTAIAKARRIGVLDAACYHYRMVRNGSLMNTEAHDDKPLCWVEAFREVESVLSADGVLENFAVGLLRSILGTGVRAMMKLAKAESVETLYRELRKEAVDLAGLCGPRIEKLRAGEIETLDIVRRNESALAVALRIAQGKFASPAGRMERALLSARRIAGRIMHDLRRMV